MRSTNNETPVERKLWELFSGVTGVAEGTHGPHLHIEFSSKMLPQKGDGYKYRCNPLYYIKLSTENLNLQKQHNKTNRSTDKV